MLYTSAKTDINTLRHDLAAWVNGEGRGYEEVMTTLADLEFTVERMQKRENANGRRADKRVSAALFYFVGWLTTRRIPAIFGAKWDPSRATSLISKFMEVNDLPEPDMILDEFKHPEK